VKQQQLVNSRATGCLVSNPFIEIGLGQFTMKDVVPIDAKGMWITKSVGSDCLTFVDQYGIANCVSGLFAVVICYGRSIPDNARSLTIAH